jgi:hypothetical protein
MSVDVDAVNDKLNGLVNLLQMVGIDGVDPSALLNEQQRSSSQKKDGASTSTPTTTQSTDSQILQIIKKLQQAQADSPEILAALQSPELRALANLAAQKEKAAEPAPSPSPSLEDVIDDDDNFPKIGPGYSDDVSVLSDLSTPTVMTKQHIAEEEYYKDVNGPGAMLPMHIGGTGQSTMLKSGGGGKTKNRLGQVNPGNARRAIAKADSALEKRRKNYKEAMAKLQADKFLASAGRGTKDKNYMVDFDPKKRHSKPQSPTKSDPSEFPSMSDGKKKSKLKDGHKRKTKKKAKGDGIDWGTNNDTEWDAFNNFDSAFGSDPFGKSEKSRRKAKAIDADGFFSNDPFANIDPFSGSSHGQTKKKKTRKTKDDGQGTRTRSDKSKKKEGRRQRRASIASIHDSFDSNVKKGV